MRKYTLVFSILVHAVVVGAAFVVSIVATNELPVLSESTRVVLATPAVPAPPPVRIVRPDVHVPSPDAAPIAEPPTIESESPRPGPVVVDQRVDGAPEGGVPGGLGSDLRGIPGDPPPPLPLPQTPLRVGGLIRPPQRIHDVAPQYPAIARAAGIKGVVILEAVITEDGRVDDVKVLRSIPLLDQAAREAVRQWRFSPTLLNGQPIPIVMTVTVAFTLN